MKKLLIGIVSLLATQMAFAGCPGYTDEELLMENDGDDRLVRSASSPEWLEAVGKFVYVKTPEWQLEQGEPKEYQHCSVSLVSDTVGGDGQIVVGAGHCIVQWIGATNSKESPYIDALRETESGEHWELDTVYDWDFNPENTVFIFTSKDGEVVKRRLADIFFAETHQGDYFIGKLDSPISNAKIKPLLNAPADYSDCLLYTSDAADDLYTV